MCVLFIYLFVFPHTHTQHTQHTQQANELANSGVRVQYTRDTVRDELVLNGGTSIGQLVIIDGSNGGVGSASLNQHSIALFATSAPPDLARVAGIVTGAPQTALSHTAVRARQNGVPNVYVRGAAAKWASLANQPVSHFLFDFCFRFDCCFFFVSFF